LLCHVEAEGRDVVGGGGRRVRFGGGGRKGG